MGAKSRSQMMASQSQHVQKRLTQLFVSQHIPDGENSACNRAAAEDGHRMLSSGPRSHRGHQLDVTAAHPPQQEEKIKNASCQEQARKTTSESGPSEYGKSDNQGGQQPAIRQPVRNACATNVVHGSRDSDG